MEDRIPEIVKKEFNAKVIEVKRITEGYSHYMFDVKIDKAPFEVIIRFSNNTKESVNLSKEKYVIELLHKHNIPAPKNYAFHHPQEKKEEGYMILEKFQGIRLDTIWKNLSKEEKIQVTKEMGKLLAKIHAIKLEDFGDILEDGKIDADKPFKFKKTGEQLPFNKFVREWLISHSRDISRLASYDHISKEFIARYYTHIMNKILIIRYEGNPILIHGDFIPGHIFVEKEKNNYKIIGIIDFEFAAAFAPEYDFLKIHREGFFDDTELKKALIESYGPINEEAVEIHRLSRDLGFAWAVLEVGNRELSDKILKSIEERINLNK